MTDELENLRPEVRRAIEVLDVRADDDWTEYFIVRAELLRLADENAELHTSALVGYEDGWHALRNERDALKAELAALKARIAGSRHAFLGPNMDRITFLADEIGPSGKYALVKVEE